MQISITKSEVSRLKRLSDKAQDVIRANTTKARDVDTARLLRKTISDILRKNKIQ